jgi:hypothetical protein
MRLRLLLPALLLACPALGQEMPIRAVTLSNAGLVQVERAGTLAPDQPARFRVPLEDVDDVLKSLLVRDPGGQVEGVRLPAQDLAAEAFRGLPLRPQDLVGRLPLLRALRGQEVAAGGIAGRLVDAQDVEADAGGRRAPALRLTLVTTQGLASVILREADSLTWTDAALAARIRRAAEAVAAASTADTREVELRLSGAAAPREVGLTYVAGAPLWKPSWRLLVPARAGAARLQGWAVVENRTGADWEGVRLALVSGNPAAFRQPLYTPIRPARPELPVRGAEQVQARADAGARPPPPVIAAAPTAQEIIRGIRPAPGAARPADSVAAAPQAEAASSAGRVAFTLPAPVTLRSGDTANLPFLDATLPAERAWWVQDLAAHNPLSAVRLRNTSGQVLPDGLVTLYGNEGAEAGGHLGDAELRAIAPEETRLLAFARDRDVRMSSAAGNSERPTGVAFRRGVVMVSLLQRQEQALTVDASGAAEAGRGALLVVDLPRRPGFTPRFAVAAEGDFGLRHEARLAGGSETLRFAFERETRNELPVWDAGLGDPILLRWTELDVEQSLRRLPGGPATLENLRGLLDRLAPEAPGRERLAALVSRLAELRALLDAARTAIRESRNAEVTLRAARAAVEDRTGPEREEARRRLNAASLAAERATAAAQAAWDQWAKTAQEIIAGME